MEADYIAQNIPQIVSQMVPYPLQMRQFPINFCLTTKFKLDNGTYIPVQNLALFGRFEPKETYLDPDDYKEVIFQKRVLKLWQT